MNPTRLQLAVVLACALAPVVGAQTTWRFIDNTLASRVGELTRLTPDHVVFTDEDGRVIRAPTESMLAMIHLLPPARSRDDRRFRVPGAIVTPDPDARAAGFAGSLTLTDGQVWRGALLSAESESVSWFFEDTVVLGASIDVIASGAIRAPLDGARRTWAGVDDRVLLTNGDVLDGFIDALGPTFVIEVEGQRIEIPENLVAGFLLANPPTSPSGQRLRTTEGSEFAAASIEISPGGDCVVYLVEATDPIEVPESLLRSVRFHPDGAAPLSDFDPHAIDVPEGGASGLTTAPDEALGFDHLVLTGPIEVHYRLPRPADRFGATVRLPPAMWAWGDCELLVHTDGERDVYRRRFSADRPEARLNVDLRGASALTIEIRPGPTGPIQDRLRLEHPTITWR